MKVDAFLRHISNLHGCGWFGRLFHHFFGMAGSYCSIYCRRLSYRLFFAKRTIFDLDSLERVEDYDKAALAAWLTATFLSGLAFWFEVSIIGIATIDALLITIPLYLLCLKIRPTCFERIEGRICENWN